MRLAPSTATAVAVSSNPLKEQQSRGTNDFGTFAATYTQCFGGGLTPGPGCSSWTYYTVAPLAFNGCGSDGHAGYDGNEKASQHLPSGFNGSECFIDRVVGACTDAASSLQSKARSRSSSTTMPSQSSAPPREPFGQWPAEGNLHVREWTGEAQQWRDGRLLYEPLGWHEGPSL